MLFESCHVPLERIVQDTVYVLFDINGLNFVKNKEIYIGISRFGSDKNICGTNCKDNSSVEYVLSTTTNTFRILKDFSFIDFFS